MKRYDKVRAGEAGGQGRGGGSGPKGESGQELEPHLVLLGSFRPALEQAILRGSQGHTRLTHRNGVLLIPVPHKERIGRGRGHLIRTLTVLNF